MKVNTATKNKGCEDISARKDIYSHPHSLRPNISISISNDVLTLNRRKERQDKLIYTNRNNRYIINIHSVLQEYTNVSQQIECEHYFIYTQYMKRDTKMVKSLTYLLCELIYVDLMFRYRGKTSSVSWTQMKDASKRVYPKIETWKTTSLPSEE